MCDWTGRDTFSITRLGCLLLFIRADRRAMRTHTDTCCHPQCCCCFSPRRAASTGVPSSARPPSAAPPLRMNKRLRICRLPAAGPRPDWTWGRCTSSPRTCTTHTHYSHTCQMSYLYGEAVTGGQTWCWCSAMTAHSEAGPAVCCRQSAPAAFQTGRRWRRELCHFLFPLSRHHWRQRRETTAGKTFMLYFHLFRSAVIWISHVTFSFV